jgi:hypothetical protein
VIRVLSPQQWHEKNHAGVFGECWYCQRARAHCRSKIRFSTWQEAEEWVRDRNESCGYVQPVTRYPCRWCDGWHMTRADDRRSAKRAERQRRKWLVQKAAAQWLANPIDAV